MIHRHSAAPQHQFSNCHDGKGVVFCRELMTDDRNSAHGFKFIHEDVLGPGDSIGEHPHHGDEEIYLFLEGRGTMIEDGVRHNVGPGDVSVTRSGHTHGLENTGAAPMKFLVICARSPQKATS